MTLDRSDLKRRLQDHLQEGLLLVAGTGLSIAEGIPGMGQLASHLKVEMASKLVATPDPGWEKVVTALDAGDHLEGAMEKTNLLPSTVNAIVALSSAYIEESEREVFGRVMTGKSVLPFTVFAKHLFKAGKQFHLITPNYDRLVELATEAAGIGVDCRFFGYLHGRTDPKRSADCHRESYQEGKSVGFRNKPCLCVYKPHGSLDWYEIDGTVVRCPTNCGGVPIIITPGASKYRESFRWAFDDQRTAGNQAAIRATRLMFMVLPGLAWENVLVDIRLGA